MDPTRRFSDRVENYKRYRPGYPQGLIDFLVAQCAPPGPVVDVGSGTGLLTEPLLTAGYEVIGVEPNAAMRQAGEEALAGQPKFRSVDGTAESMPVADHWAGWVVAAQAFHWFRPVEARAEFQRVLAPGGQCALIWNNRETDTTPFLAGYEAALLRYCPDYARIQATHAEPEEIAAFFAPQSFSQASFPNHQLLDLTAVRGRLLSSSYVPKEGAAHHALLNEMEQLFDRHATGNTIELRYQTVVFHGPLC